MPVANGFGGPWSGSTAANLNCRISASPPNPDEHLAETAALAVLTLGIALWTRSNHAPQKAPQIRQLTDFSAENYITSAALSQDGLSMAFADLDGALHIQDVATASDRIRARMDHDRIETIFWIPGKHKLLLSGRDLSTDTYAYHLWTFDLDGAKLTQLRVEGRRAAPSRDGFHIAYLSPDGASIWVADADGAGPRRVVVTRGNLKYFVWSRDRDLIHYWTVSAGLSRSPQDWKGWTFNSVDSTTGRTVADQACGVMLTPFALPGWRLLYRNPQTDVQDILEARVDPATGRLTGKPVPLGAKTSLGESISASLDGRRIAAVVNRDLHPHVYVGDLRPGSSALLNPRRLVLEDTDSYPKAWTPDSGAVILESTLHAQKFHVYVYPIDRKSGDTLVNMPQDQVSPKLSPDGRWVLFLTGHNKAGGDTPGATRSWDLMRVPAGGGTPEPVPTGGPVQEFDCAYRASRCVLRRCRMARPYSSSWTR